MYPYSLQWDINSWKLFGSFGMGAKIREVFLTEITEKHRKDVQAIGYFSSMELSELSYKVRGAIYQVHVELGPGLFESVYESALAYELKSLNLKVKCQVSLPVRYKGVLLDMGFRIDLMVENEIIVELKSIDQLHDIHKKQLLTYLKLSEKRVGFLVNFNVYHLVDKISLIRIVN